LEAYLLRVKLGDGIPLIIFLTILLIFTVIFPLSNVVRIVLGILFLLFFPGYVLLVALFPQKDRLDSIERVALSSAVTIAIVVILGLILNYTSWGIRLETILYSITGLTCIIAIVALFRRYHLPKEQRVNIEFHLVLPGWQVSLNNKILSIVLTLTIFCSFGLLGYLIFGPKVWEKYSEYYILGSEGEVGDYPEVLSVGEEGNVTVVIINHEQDALTYQIEVMIDQVNNNEVGPIMLEDEEKWEGTVIFIPDKVGNKQRVDFWISKNGDIGPDFQPLRLWVDVAR